MHDGIEVWRLKNRKSYRFDQPIRIIRLKANGLDIIFYTFLFCLLAAAILYIMCMKDGKFGIYFELWRVLVSIPLIIFSTYPLQLLKELRTYVPLLSKKSTWELEDLKKLTKKDERETIRIITRVLESAFIVDPACEEQV